VLVPVPVPAHQATFQRFGALSTTAPPDSLMSMLASVRIQRLLDKSLCQPGKRAADEALRDLPVRRRPGQIFAISLPRRG